MNMLIVKTLSFSQLPTLNLEHPHLFLAVRTLSRVKAILVEAIVVLMEGEISDEEEGDGGKSLLLTGVSRYKNSLEKR